MSLKFFVIWTLPEDEGRSEEFSRITCFDRKVDTEKFVADKMGRGCRCNVIEGRELTIVPTEVVKQVRLDVEF